MTIVPEPLTVAVRVYAERDDRTSRRPPRRRQRIDHQQLTLVFDCETTTDASQRLLYGCWRLYQDRPGALPGRFCIEEGLLYADELPNTDPAAYATLVDYARTHPAAVFPGVPDQMRLLSRADFVEAVLYRWAYKKRAAIVGFNLPFDLSRIAVAAAPARGRYAGGFSLRFWERERFRPRIVIKTIDSKRHLIAFTAPDGDDPHDQGNFVDLRTLAFALTDRGHTLESACAAFGVTFRKRAVVHGAVTTGHIHYCREDVAATAQLNRAAVADLRTHPVELGAGAAFSPASLGKAYLRAMDIRPIL